MTHPTPDQLQEIVEAKVLELKTELKALGATNLAVLVTANQKPGDPIATGIGYVSSGEALGVVNTYSAAIALALLLDDFITARGVDPMPFVQKHYEGLKAAHIKKFPEGTKQ